EQWLQECVQIEASGLLLARSRHPLRGLRRLSYHVSTGSRTHPWLYSGIPSGIQPQKLTSPDCENIVDFPTAPAYPIRAFSTICYRAITQLSESRNRPLKTRRA